MDLSTGRTQLVVRTELTGPRPQMHAMFCAGTIVPKGTGKCSAIAGSMVTYKRLYPREVRRRGEAPVSTHSGPDFCCVEGAERSEQCGFRVRQYGWVKRTCSMNTEQ